MSESQVSNKITVLIADDHGILRDGLRALLSREEDIEVVGDAADGLQAVDLARELSPDIVLMDISMPELDGIEATRRIVGDDGRTKVLVLTQYDSRQHVERVFRAGAAGYLLKKAVSSELASAIRAVHNGGSFLAPQVARTVIDSYVAGLGKQEDGLTEREAEVLKLLAEGHSNQEIADVLCLSVNTVVTHRTKIMAKLGLRNRTELIKYAIRQGLIDIES